MKTLVLAASFSFSAIHSTNVREGSGKIIEESRPVRNFHAIAVENNIAARLAPGPFQIRIKADDNILPAIETEVSGGVLRLRYKKGWAFQSRNPVEVFIQAPEIDAIRLSGASQLKGNLHAKDELEIDTSGGTQLKLGKLNVRKLNVDTSGASIVKLEQWEGQSLNLDTSGGSMVAFGQTLAKSVKIDASGASQIELEGSADKADINTSGGTSLKADEWNVKAVTLDASGASTSRLRGALSITGNLSGGSTVHAARSAQVDVERTVASSLIQK